MANGDYGYFGKGNTGYAQYMTAFNRCGCLIAIAVVVVLVLIAMGS